jgi:hypothetical protein
VYLQQLSLQVVHLGVVFNNHDDRPISPGMTFRHCRSVSLPANHYSYYNVRGAHRFRPAAGKPMEQPRTIAIELPPAADIRLAVELYLKHAYGPEPPAAARRFLPPGDADPAGWLMGDLIERDPSDAPLDAVRSFAMRIGNAAYLHMKLRLSRPPRDRVFLFSVDSHDVFLKAVPGSADYASLEELKRRNAAVSAEVTAAWDAAGLPTERNYLRQKVRQARASACDEPMIPPPPRATPRTPPA